MYVVWKYGSKLEVISPMRIPLGDPSFDIHMKNNLGVGEGGKGGWH